MSVTVTGESDECRITFQEKTLKTLLQRGFPVMYCIFKWYDQHREKRHCYLFSFYQSNEENRDLS